MFCPNCGTKNADTEAKCAQCGFDLQAKAPQARFKGTMVMAPAAAKAAPGPAAPAAAPPAGAPAAAAKPSALKGTMIGVAPPEMARALEEAKAKAAAAATPAAAPPAGAKPTLKGTMIGVAPPDMQAAIAAAKAKSGIGEPPAAQPAGAVQPPAVQPAGAAPAPKPSIKGTMIGVAPPDMQAAIAAAKADLEKRAAAEVAATMQMPATPPEAPGKTQSPLGRAPNSKLKGTMIGVAPPDVSEVLARAKSGSAQTGSAAEHSAAHAPTPRDGIAAARRGTPNPDLGATMVGTAAPVTESLRPGPTAHRSPSDDFKGTMVGATSPFVESEDRHDLEQNGPDSRAAGNSDHPAAFASTSLSEQAEILAARANLQRVLAESEATPRPPNGREIPTGAQSPAALRSIAQQQKKSAMPLLILGVALLVVAVLIGVALVSRSSAPPEDPSAADPKAAPVPPK